MTKKSIALEYSKQYPKWADLTLAKKIHKDHPTIFDTVEKARNRLRYVRGKHGNFNKQFADDPKPITHDTRNWKPFKEEVNTGAKVLILDIETAPIVAYTWGIWNQNIQPSNIASDWFCITWAAKWLFEEKVYSGKLTGKEAIAQDDSRMIKGIWSLLNEADIVIAHNGQKFDIPKLNSRFIINQLSPPLPYQQIDTLLHIRRQFGFTSNKLDYVNQLLNLPRKKENEGMPLWIKCYKGDTKAIGAMLDYNIADVRILEETYLRIRAWIKPHPNMGLHILDSHERCPSCGSDNVKDCGKGYHTQASIFEIFRCDNCGSTGRRRKNIMTLTEKRNSLLSIPK
jgi:predicted RNA-binding Zn-ribbon protein involved in translation (DUF1610 family)